jgi:hypothetical protein
MTNDDIHITRSYCIDDTNQKIEDTNTQDSFSLIYKFSEQPNNSLETFNCTSQINEVNSKFSLLTNCIKNENKIEINSLHKVNSNNQKENLKHFQNNEIFTKPKSPCNIKPKINIESSHESNEKEENTNETKNYLVVSSKKCCIIT